MLAVMASAASITPLDVFFPFVVPSWMNYRNYDVLKGD